MVDMAGGFGPPMNSETPVLAPVETLTHFVYYLPEAV